MCLGELHGKPDRDVELTKNHDFIPKYQKLIKTLKEKNLYGDWFFEWY